MSSQPSSSSRSTRCYQTNENVSLVALQEIVAETIQRFRVRIVAHNMEIF